MNWKQWIWPAVGVVALFLILGNRGRSRSQMIGQQAFQEDMASGAAIAQALQLKEMEKEATFNESLRKLSLQERQLGLDLQKGAAALQLEAYKAEQRILAVPIQCPDGSLKRDTDGSLYCRKKTSGLRKPAKAAEKFLRPSLKSLNPFKLFGL